MKLSIVIPTYNEQENVEAMTEAVISLFSKELQQYEWELLYIDNKSTDHTRELLRKICNENPKVKAIFNTRNFGQFNSPYYGMLQATGDCVIKISADFQEPLECIPQMVEEWASNGHKVIMMQKTASEENRVIYHLRSWYYKSLRRFSDVEILEHVTGFGLYDRSIIEILRDLKDPTPFLRGMIAELGFPVKVIPYTQKKRRAGISHNNFMTLYDAMMLSYTSYTKIGLRISTFLGFFVAFISMIIAIFYLIMKLLFWDRFAAGAAPILLGMFFLGAVILVFLGIIGEYILSINIRLMNRPLVIEEERLNFDI